MEKNIMVLLYKKAKRTDLRNYSPNVISFRTIENI